MKKLLVLFVIIAISCKKQDFDASNVSSVKIQNSIEALTSLKMAKSKDGRVLISNYDGLKNPDFARLQQLQLIKSNGELIRLFSLSDTIFQFVTIMEGIDNGFFVTATGSNQDRIYWYKLDDDGNIEWSGNKIMIASGHPLYEPALTKSSDDNYLILYFNSGSGYYIQKLDLNGNSIFNKKVPPPIANHLNIGLNYGESVLDFYQPNDSMIVLQGELYDQYSGVDITNCFIRGITSEVSHKWFSDNYDSTRLEIGAGLYNSQEGKILFFGTKSQNNSLEGFGTVFIRKYSLFGELMSEDLLPQVEGTPTIIKRVLKSPDNGFLLVGSNNQFPENDVVSPNNIILLKLNSDLSINWISPLHTLFPGRGFDIIYFNDGTIGLAAFLKENYSINRVMYMHLDMNGNIIA